MSTVQGPIELTERLAGGSARLQGKTALVTGASRGLGLAVATRLVAEGARVVLTARHQETLDAATESLGGPEHALGIVGKADDPEHQERAVELAIERFSSLDMLVNNAGINTAFAPLIEVELSAANKMLTVNCLAALAWTQRAHRLWMRAHGGAVVNIGSVAGLKPAENIGLYGATKAALHHVTQQLALELAPSIRVNAVAPAVVKTVFASALFEGQEAEIASKYPLERLGRPADVAGAVCFLLSEDAAWITGEIVTIDGGLLLTGGV